MSCHQFCNGPKNTGKGLVAIDLHPEVAANFKVQRTKDGYLCPLGCLHNPLDKATAIKLINNSGRHHICRDNPFKHLKVA